MVHVAFLSFPPIGASLGRAPLVAISRWSSCCSYNDIQDYKVLFISSIGEWVSLILRRPPPSQTTHLPTPRRQQVAAPRSPSPPWLSPISVSPPRCISQDSLQLHPSLSYSAEHIRQPCSTNFELLCIQMPCAWCVGVPHNNARQKRITQLNPTRTQTHAPQSVPSSSTTKQLRMHQNTTSPHPLLPIHRCMHAWGWYM